MMLIFLCLMREMSLSNGGTTTVGMGLPRIEVDVAGVSWRDVLGRIGGLIYSSLA
jgi:hypothetical protein